MDADEGREAGKEETETRQFGAVLARLLPRFASEGRAGIEHARKLTRGLRHGEAARRDVRRPTPSRTCHPARGGASLTFIPLPAGLDTCHSHPVLGDMPIISCLFTLFACHHCQSQIA